MASDRLEACPPGTEVVRQASDSRPDRRILWLGPALTGLTLAPAWLNNPTCQGTSPPRWQRPQMMKMMKKLCAGSLPRRALASKRRARNWPRRVSRASPRSCGRPGSLAARHQARHQRRPHRKLSRRCRRISHRRRHGLAPQNPRAGRAQVAASCAQPISLWVRASGRAWMLALRRTPSRRSNAVQRERHVLVHLSRRFRRTKMSARVESMNKKKRRTTETIKNLKRGIYRLRWLGRRKRMSRLAKQPMPRHRNMRRASVATGLARTTPSLVRMTADLHQGLASAGYVDSPVMLGGDCP